MSRPGRILASSLVAWLALAGVARAAEEPEIEQRVGLAIGSEWASDEWLQPNGTRIRVAGQYGRLGLTARWPWRHHADLTVHGLASPLSRGDTGDTLMRVGGQVTLSGTRSWSHLAHATGDYQLDAGLGLVADVQSHLTSGAVVARPRDYLDETQLRFGPVGRFGILWFHPTDPAWRARLDLGACPTALGFSTGGVAYPVIWLGGDAGLAFIRRLGPGEVSLGVEARGWRGETFSQLATGVYLRGSWRI